jgi:hypothetical protein
MADFMRAGGAGIWVVLLFGVLCLVSGLRFAIRSEPSRLKVATAMTWSTVFAVLSAVTGNLAMVFWRISQHPEWSKSEDLPLIVMTGLAEVLTPAILGFAALGVAWLFVAVGLRRAYAED